MPRIKSQWEVRDDLKPMLKKVIRLFPTVLSHIDRHRIFLCSFTARKSNKLAAVSPNRQPWSILLPEYDYCIRVWKERWADTDYEKQLYVMLHELLHIPPYGMDEFHKNYRKTLDHDLKDFKRLREVYGVLLHDVKDILKGEEHLLKDREHKRFPRIPKEK